jgi:phage terminase large subunit
MITAEIEVRREFLPLFGASPPRFSVVVAHRRAGKTVAAVQKLIAAALDKGPANRRYAFVAPLRIQAKNVAWDYLKRMVRAFPRSNINESELRVDLLNGSRIQLYGADNPDALRGGYLDGVVLDEHSQMDPRTWDEILRPMLADRQGWALFIGTPAGKNEFWRLYEHAATADGWARFMFRASETGIIQAGELAAAKAAMSDEAYQQEFECSFTSSTRGAFYGALMEAAEFDGRITKVPYDPSLQCITAWDLGVRDSTAIWIVQPAPGGAIHVIDYIESSGVGLDWYADALKAKPYRYSQHIAPHDIEVTELGTGRSRREVAGSLGIAFDVCRQHKVPDGINAVRVLIPRMWFDREKCARGIEALAQYRQEWDGKLQAFRASPLHDWCSHGADAMRYYAMGIVSTTATLLDDPSVRINIRSERNAATSNGYRRSSGAWQ